MVCAGQRLFVSSDRDLRTGTSCHTDQMGDLCNECLDCGVSGMAIARFAHTEETSGNRGCCQARTSDLDDRTRLLRRVLKFTHWVAAKISRGRVLQCGASPRADDNWRLPEGAQTGG